MKTIRFSIFSMAMAAAVVSAQTFNVTGSQIPGSVLTQNYGKMPKGISAFDLDICNVTKEKQSIVSSEIYQALTRENPLIAPIGRNIMLASILRNRGRSTWTIMGVTLNSATGIFAVLSSTKYSLPTGWGAGIALGALSLQQVMSSLKPVLSADKLEKFETQVLEPGLILDGGSCVERTVFAVLNGSKASTHPNRGNLSSFHVR